MAMSFKKRLLAVLLCLVFVVCMVVQPVFATPALPAYAFEVLIAATIITGLGVVFLSDQDAVNGINSFLAEIQRNNEQRNAFFASCASYAQQGLQGFNDSLTYANLKQYADMLAGMGYVSTDVPLSMKPVSGTPAGAFKFSDYASSLAPFNAWGACGGDMVVGYGDYIWDSVVVTQPAYVNGVPKVYVMNTSSYRGVLNASNATCVGSLSGSWGSNYRFDNISGWFLVSDGVVAPGVEYTYVPDDKSYDSFYNFEPNNGFPKIPKWFFPAAWLAATLSAFKYTSQQNTVQDKLNQQPAAGHPNFIAVTSPVGGKHFADVIDYTVTDTSSTTSSDVTSSGGSSSLPADSPLTIGGIKSLFMPAPDYLSRKFNTMLTKFPDLGDLAELRGLTTLGEKKPDMPIILNNYFGITTTQKGVDVDLWDDKRTTIKGWVKGFVVILTIIFNFNMIYKLIRGTAFSDVGTGSKGGKEGGS